jgi:class 3 adenylate cyclase/predicted ATPase
MEFADILEQTIALLQHQGRISYGALKRRFGLDDAYLEDLKIELVEAQQLARDENGRILVWVGQAAPAPPPVPEPALNPAFTVPQDEFLHVERQTPEAERRQLTVLFCDLVDSTALAGQLDPEDLREVIRAYQAACATVIEPLEGHIAQYLGDGLLVYFGYPQAHEDDAQRAVRAGLGMVAAMQALNTHLVQRHGLQIAVRIGIHTGVVVVGEMGGGSRQEQLALGDTPNMAARLQGLAGPDTVVLSAATFRLVQGYFTYQDLGAHVLKGIAAPIPVYRVLGESGVQSRLEAIVPSRLTPLVGRGEEVALLQQRWVQAKTGQGQVVLLSGEAGIGKSRLVQVLKDHVAHEPHARIEWRGSSYHQQSALYPVIAHLHRLLQWREDETPQEKLHKLETTLASSGLVLPEVVPLLTALLSLPLPSHYPALTLTPQRQRQKTLETLLTWLAVEARRQPVLVIVEDLHWIDPSTLELLSLLIDQGASARLCLVLTARPEFRPPWAMVAHLTALTLRRLAPAQVTRLASHIAGDKILPPAVLEEVVRKTDGVPLFVEELTKVALESGLLQEQEDRYDLTSPLPPLAIPATLHDALMARLDRLAAAKLVAQLGAVIGRTFAYDLVQAVAPLDAATLQGALAQLVEAELVAQRGTPPQATYTFKHALVQDAAYQSLLRSTRQQYHQRIAQVLVERFPETAETQPELLAQHYTEAGLSEQAIAHWQRAGQRASERSAHLEAIAHLTKGLEMLNILPNTPERTQHELDLHLTLGPALMVTKGWADPEVERVYTRVRALCQQIGEPPQLFPALWGLWLFYAARGELQPARELGEQLLVLAERVQEPMLLVQAYHALGPTLFWLGELVPAQALLAQGLACYDPQQHRANLRYGGHDAGWCCRSYAAWTLWALGYPDQALHQEQEALWLAQELAHPATLVNALDFAAWLHQFRREGPATQAQAEAAMPMASEHGFVQWLAEEKVLWGWALAAQGQGEAGIAQMREGLATWKAIRVELYRAYQLLQLAEVYGAVGQAEEGLRVLAEARAAVPRGEGRFFEAELSRLEGELLLARSVEHYAEAEACFHQALAIARRQQAKSWELRAATSLARLWQHQDKRAAAYELLAPIYGWFTEGFDTADLQDAKALLAALA